MESFSHLLNDYIRRAGISDTELARAIGASRQTIFRWREGVTGRPRQREDVLIIAHKLRLTPEERDKLLLAAGFRPEEEVKRGDEEARRRGEKEAERGGGGDVRTRGGEEVKRRDETSPSEIIASSPHESSFHESSPPVSSPFRQRLLAVAAGLLLVVTTIWLANRGPGDFSGTLTPLSRFASSSPVPAQPGETVVLVTHFANYASSQVGYNVAGRLAQALQTEVEQTQPENIRIVIWPEPVGERSEALQAGQAVSATLVIYGEYDVGRIIVRFAQPADQKTFVDPALLRQVVDVADLSATINTHLPQQVRFLALLALGQIYLNKNEAGQALPLLVQAREHLQNDPQVDSHTRGLAYFYLGIAYHHSQPPQLDEAIAAYSRAVEAWPEMISSRLNRSAAYVARRKKDDLELALADADRIVALRPEWAAAYNNRASIYWNMSGADNLALALADLEKALALDATLPEAYFNRAYIRFQQGLSIKEVAPDLEKALTLRSGYANVLNLLCWGYAVEQQPDVALPYCQQAVAANPQPVFFDSRGLTYALLGDYPAAVADLERYVAWLEQQPDETWQTALSRRQSWINKLKSGQNPFTPAVLAELRREFGQ